MSLKSLLTLTVISSLILLSTCYADELQIPFSCYPKEIQQAFADEGYKVDLSGNDRDERSWGFIVNQGSQFTIYTYRNVTQEEFGIIMEIING